jgi:hypothetical protein
MMKQKLKDDEERIVDFVDNAIFIWWPQSRTGDPTGYQGRHSSCHRRSEEEGEPRPALSLSPGLLLVFP